MFPQLEFLDSAQIDQQLRQAPLYDRLTTDALNQLMALDQQMNQLIRVTKKACELEETVSEKEHQIQELERLNMRLKRRQLTNMEFVEELRALGFREKGRVFDNGKMMLRVEDDESVRVAFSDPEYIHEMMSNSNIRSGIRQ